MNDEILNVERQDDDGSGRTPCCPVFVVVQEMDCDHGGGADVVAAYDSNEKADARIKTLEYERDENDRRYKYSTSWFVVELEMNKDDRW